MAVKINNHIVEIDNEFTIKRDPDCWIVEITRDGLSRKTKQSIIVTDRYYYSTLFQCCKFILDKSVNRDTTETIKELMDKITNIGSKLETAIKTIGEWRKVDDQSNY